MTGSTTTARIVFAGGGTGGHLFPAIAIADRIRELLEGRRPVEIIFVGTKRGLEHRMRDRIGYPLQIINVRGLVRSFTLKNLLVPFVLMTALIRAWLLLGRFRPQVVVGTGGYVALPVLKAAGWRGVPTVLQEQNSFPGITTRQGAVRARKIYLGFPGAVEHMKTDAEVVVSGNPVRRTLNQGSRIDTLISYGLDPEKKTILVLGGSQGARPINNAILKNLGDHGLPEDYQMLWQTGKRDYKDVTARVGRKVKDCALFPFADDMAGLYAAADLAIARAGALTLAELAACGVPSILVPYPHAAGDHQRKNAEEYARMGLARVIDETELSSRDILEEARGLLESEACGEMKERLDRRLAEMRPAVDVIAEGIIELLDQQN